MAGADIIETNTFSSTSVSMADYHVQEYVREMNLAAVKLAREVADEFSTPDKPRFVAGSIGPTNKTCSMSPDVNNPAMRALTYDELADAYREQMEALLEGGVDALLIETIFDTLNAKAAILCCGKGDGGYRRSSSCYAVRYRIRYRRTYSVGTDFGGFSCLSSACQYLFGRLELLLWSPPVETFPGTACCPCSLLSIWGKKMRDCPTAWDHVTRRLPIWRMK